MEQSVTMPHEIRWLDARYKFFVLIYGSQQIRLSPTFLNENICFVWT
ncbi:hypothetical protein BCL69_103317 [Nitrosomonas communis]|uniref:Uncharacterized protein n=1 Tax=Nitrosomonas communis TaxID=44574 RepID=A0A1H2WS58_9PROT|nr:hypothetical protein BCL69_103317 [Nitrosomonas communis]SDW83385.1 hypothetical protein SAMN05421882_103112 [Nitrosomonas communis]